MTRRSILPKQRLQRPPAETSPLRRRQIVGILILAAAILAVTLLRADWHAIFPTGWWRW